MRTETGSKADVSRFGLDVPGWRMAIWTSDVHFRPPSLDHGDLMRASDSSPGFTVRRRYANVESTSSIPNQMFGWP